MYEWRACTKHAMAAETEVRWVDFLLYVEKRRGKVSLRSL